MAQANGSAPSSFWSPSAPSNHFAPHSGTTFEGYYSKFRLPSGASIALIISTIPGVAPQSDLPTGSTFSLASLLSTKKPASGQKGAPYLIVFAYVSVDGRKWYLKEWNPEHLHQKIADGGRGFEWSWAEGMISWDGGDVLRWELDYPEVKFSSSTGLTAEGKLLRTPWNPALSTSTPAGFLADLPLPIQWHVHSTDSSCDFTLSLTPSGSADPSREPPLPPSDQSGSANVHTEKNWAFSFPSAYIWIQSRDHTTRSGLCVAGGSLIPGVEAFLVGYTSKTGQFISFKPPTSTSIFSVSLGLTSDISYPKRKAEIDIRGWFTRLKIAATAPEDTFFPLSAPLSTGHSSGYTEQSFGASVEVKVYKRGWWGNWEEQKGLGERWESGSLEFGGDYYKPHVE